VRIRFRIITVSAVAGLALAGPAGPAFAHVEVKANKTTAGAANVTLTFTGEAENPAAGIKSERVILPAGVDPGKVTAGKLPSGWTFTAADDGFTVGGKALKTGTDAVWSVLVARFPPNATRLSFKTLETYGNGDISRWIEIQDPGQAEPDNPAPLLTLKPGPKAAPSSPVASPTAGTALVPASSPPAFVAAPTPGPGENVADTSGSSTWWIWVIILALIIIAGVVFVMRRLRRSSIDRGDG
jgi:Domain of unkown function (DUF1775)